MKLWYLRWRKAVWTKRLHKANYMINQIKWKIIVQKEIS